MEDCSNTTTALEEANDSLDDPECREDSEDESRDMNEAWRTGGQSQVPNRERDLSLDLLLER